jgi:uncharacterized protein (DUF2235 family)
LLRGEVSSNTTTTGYGLDTNVLAAYQFLVNHWRAGDRIYPSGFSRGA